MPGVVTQYAQYRLDQLTAILAEAEADARRFQSELNNANAVYAAGKVGFGHVRDAQERFEQARARRDGASINLERRQREMRDPQYQAKLERLDKLEEQAEALDLATVFSERFAERINAAMASLLVLIPEFQSVVAEAAEPLRLLIQETTDLGMSALFSGRRVLDQETALAIFRNAVSRAIEHSQVSSNIVRAATGIKT
jgi:hypothetical protein